MLPLPRRQQHPLRNTSPPSNQETNTCSSGAGTQTARRTSPPSELEVPADPPRNRVPGVADPEPLALVGLPPGERAGGPHELPEYLRIVARVQDDEPHPLEHARLHPAHHLVAHLVVGLVAPPGQHVGVPQPLRRTGRARAPAGSPSPRSPREGAWEARAIAACMPSG
jgi:hypothetical protein